MDRQPRSRLNAQISDEACEWFIESRAGDLDEAARREFDRWLRTSPEHLRAYLEIAAIWNEGPALDPTRIASQSRPIIEGLLRGELGFRGVVITDSMEARASLATGGITAVSERAVRAGSDLVLLTGRGSYVPVFEHLLAVARRSPAFRARIRQAAGRVLLLKARGARLFKAG